MSHFLKLRVLRDLADGPTRCYLLQHKYQRLNLCKGKSSTLNALVSLCDEGYACYEKIGEHKQYFISPKGLNLLEYFQFDRDKK